jgi:hypothetical protein
MKKYLLLSFLVYSLNSIGQSVTILPGNNNQGNILLNSKQNPSMVMFPSGTQNPKKMVISHSPGFPSWGLQYNDTTDVFHFKNSSSEAMTIDLFNRRIGIGVVSPTNKLHVSGGNWDLTNAANGDFKIGDDTYNFRIGVATGGGGAGDIRMFARGGTNRFIWGTNGTDKMALNSAGDLGIGTITPEAKLHINHGGSDIDPHIRINATSLSGSGSGARINWTTSANANKWVAQSYLNGLTSNLNYWRLEYGSSSIFNIYGNQTVGIGTGESASNGKFAVHYNSGTGNPHVYLNEINSSTDGARITFANTGATATKFWDVYGRPRATNSEAEFNFWYETYGNVMILKGDGNVGIGTANTAGHKLNVNGIIRANEVVVETGWADYVFENDYKLKDLKEVEHFISENKHLPDVPSAKSIQEKGAHVSELMTKMMAKIEELTLYTIQQQKEIEELKSKIK